jgi:hypothetical protein
VPPSHPWAAASALAAALTLVTPLESGCSGTNLHWWVLEPAARLVGTHDLFRQGAPGWPAVIAGPALVLALGVATLAVGWVDLGRRRAAGTTRGPALASLGCGALAAVSGAWALAWVLAA